MADLRGDILGSEVPDIAARALHAQERKVADSLPEGPDGLGHCP
jgi:hypothetical protein